MIQYFESSCLKSNCGLIETKIIRDEAGGYFYGPGDDQNRNSHFNDIFGGHYDYCI